MRKIFITLLTGLFLFLNNTNAQLTVSMSSSEVDPGANATVDVTVSGFTNLSGNEYSINYDSTVLEFVMFSNVTNLLDGLNGGLSGPIGSSLKKGQIVVSWFNGNGQTVPNGTRIFSIVFKAIGAAGSKSDVLTSNTPRKIEIIDVNLNPVNLLNNKGVVTIKGTTPQPTCVDPACANASNLTFTGAVINTFKDQTICVPITVKNFNMMQSGQGSIKWDPAILQFTEAKTPASGGIPGFSGGFNTNNAPTGEFKYLWFNDNPAIPLTLADNTVVLELCFKVLGNAGQTGCVQIGQGGLETIWENDNGGVPVCFGYGKVNIGTTTGGGDDVIFKTSSGTGAKGEIICLDITVEKFTKIFGFNTKFKWNTAELKFVSTEMFDLVGLNPSLFNHNATAGELGLLWSNPDGITQPDGHRIFKICFEILVCDATNPIVSVITVPGPTQVVGEVGGVPADVGFMISGGNITISPCGDPTITCTTGAIVQADCFGGANGSIAMTVTNATNDCVFQWKNAAGGIVKTGLVSAGPNLIGVAAGTYSFEVLCSGVSKCLNPNLVIGQPTAITIPATNVVTDVICNEKGAINISTTSGGNGGYTYVWAPALGNISNPANLNAGTYLVTVSDSKSCTATATFVVGTQQSKIVIPTTNVVTGVACGQKGAINILATSGGNGTLTFKWVPELGNIGNPVNLDEGTYAVTVTDTKGCTATASFVVNDNKPDLVLTATGVNVKCKDGSDGALSATATGGCPPYNYTWQGGSTQNVKAGVYSVTVTDSSVPAESKTASVTITEPTAVAIALTNIIGTTTPTASDGKVTLTISGGNAPYRTMWSGGIPDGNTSSVIDVNNLKVGSYNVTVTDANGCTAVRSNIEVPVGTPPDKAPKIASFTLTSDFSGFGVQCFGDNNGSVLLKLTEGKFPMTVTLKAGPQTISEKEINALETTFSGLVAATYVVEVKNSVGMVTSSSLVVSQPTKLAATQKVNCTQLNQETGSIELTMNNTGAGNYGYQWFGLSDLNNKVENLGVGVYNVTITDNNGCELKLTNIEIKNCDNTGDCYVASSVITPNGDNFNDIFKINCVQDSPSDLSVFDRWGRLVYSQANYDNTWQGIETDGTDLNEGGYIWVLNVNFGQGRREIYKGTLTILRGK